MYNESRGHTPDNLIWHGKDYQNVTVCLFVPERDHILEGHSDMLANNFTAIYDTVSSPDSVYESGSHDNRKVFFKDSEKATYSPKFLTKTIVEYNEDQTAGFIVTAMPAKKEGGNVGKQVYPEDNV